MKILKKFILLIIIIILIFGSYLFIGQPPQSQKIIWGVNFSQKHSQNLGLDWKENYSALLEDLKVKKLKIATHWDLIEPEKDRYYFDDIDWQIEKTKEKGAEIILVIGMKTPRWPECHLPHWVKNLTKQEQQKEILELLKEIVLRYQNTQTIKIWQVENEPFFPFGDCPWRDNQFLKKEVALVKSLDPLKRPVIISDTGEWSFWFRAAKIGDIVGVTTYKKVWFREGGFYVSLPFPPTYYWRRTQFVKRFFNKEVIGVELQAEPWGPTLLYDSPMEEQKKTMNLEQFRKNIEFAKKTGLNAFYLWGAEWWFWLKEKQNQPEIWKEAKKLF